jgi:hypothetical protein
LLRNFPLKPFFGILSSSIHTMWPAHASFLILICPKERSCFPSPGCPAVGCVVPTKVLWTSIERVSSK